MKYSDLLFRSGVIVNNSVFYMDAFDPKVGDIDTPNYALCRYDNKSQDITGLNMRENIIGYTVIKEPNERIFGITKEGEYFVEMEDGIYWGNIDISNEAPNYLRHLTALCQINRYIYIVGMRRMVYRYSIDSDAWERVDNGVRQNISEEDEVFGFYAIAGQSKSELYAVGIRGDVWEYSEDNWIKLPAITNSDLLDVVLLANGTVIACGSNGTVIRGSHEQWEVVSNNIEEGAFISLATSGNIVYLVSDSQKLYEIKDGEISSLSEFDVLAMKANHISFDEGMFLVVGNQEIAVLDRGEWKKYNAIEKDGELDE